MAQCRRLEQLCDELWVEGSATLKKKVEKKAAPVSAKQSAVQKKDYKAGGTVGGAKGRGFSPCSWAARSTVVARGEAVTYGSFKDVSKQLADGTLQQGDMCFDPEMKTAPVTKQWDPVLFFAAVKMAEDNIAGYREASQREASNAKGPEENGALKLGMIIVLKDGRLAQVASEVSGGELKMIVYPSAINSLAMIKVVKEYTVCSVKVTDLAQTLTLSGELPISALSKDDLAFGKQRLAAIAREKKMK